MGNNFFGLDCLETNFLALDLLKYSLFALRFAIKNFLAYIDKEIRFYGYILVFQKLTRVIRNGNDNILPVQRIVIPATTCALLIITITPISTLTIASAGAGTCFSVWTYCNYGI